MATACRWPPESCRTGAFTLGTRIPTSRSVSSAALLIARLSSVLIIPSLRLVISRPRKMLPATSNVSASAESW